MKNSYEIHMKNSHILLLKLALKFVLKFVHENLINAYYTLIVNHNITFYRQRVNPSKK